MARRRAEGATKRENMQQVAQRRNAEDTLCKRPARREASMSDNHQQPAQFTPCRYAHLPCCRCPPHIHYYTPRHPQRDGGQPARRRRRRPQFIPNRLFRQHVCRMRKTRYADMLTKSERRTTRAPPANICEMANGYGRAAPQVASKAARVRTRNEAAAAQTRESWQFVVPSPPSRRAPSRANGVARCFAMSATIMRRCQRKRWRGAARRAHQRSRRTRAFAVARDDMARYADLQMSRGEAMPLPCAPCYAKRRYRRAPMPTQNMAPAKRVSGAACCCRH